MALVASVWRPSLLLSRRAPSQLPRIRLKVVAIKKQDFTTKRQQQPIGFPPKLTKSLLARSAIAVFALGFIDAGWSVAFASFGSIGNNLTVLQWYSGDWSKIGVISKDAEELLKLAAFLVVPLCIFVIYSLSNEKNELN